MTGGRDRKAGWDRRGAGGTNGRLTRPTLNYWPSRSAMSTRTLSKGMCFRASTLPTAQVVSRPPEDAIPTRTQIRCSDVAPEMAIRRLPGGIDKATATDGRATGGPEEKELSR